MKKKMTYSTFNLKHSNDDMFNLLPHQHHWLIFVKICLLWDTSSTGKVVVLIIQTENHFHYLIQTNKGTINNVEKNKIRHKVVRLVYLVLPTLLKSSKICQGNSVKKTLAQVTHRKELGVQKGCDETLKWTLRILRTKESMMNMIAAKKIVI